MTIKALATISYQNQSISTRPSATWSEVLVLDDFDHYGNIPIPASFLNEVDGKVHLSQALEDALMRAIVTPEMRAQVTPEQKQAVARLVRIIKTAPDREEALFSDGFKANLAALLAFGGIPTPLVLNDIAEAVTSSKHSFGKAHDLTRYAALDFRDAHADELAQPRFDHDDYGRIGAYVRSQSPKALTAVSDREFYADDIPISTPLIDAFIQDVIDRCDVWDFTRDRRVTNPPVSQPLAEVADPWYGLSTHPDIVEIMWRLDDGLPQRCRWVLWGRPALVHPETGVVFAVGFGSIGHVMRLPPQVLDSADPRHARTVVSGNPGQTFDISPAGPEWRFVSARAREAEWCRAAYEFAGTRAP